MAEEEVYGVHDKRGRFIPMEEYARMVSHVKLRDTHTKGMEGLIQEHGFDLVRISHHVHKPDICTPIEGKVYSLTGNTPGWPKLPRHTPFHVGCRHVETPFVDTFLSDEKIAELQEQSASEAPLHVYTPEQLARADAKRAQRERGRKLRKARERKNAAAVASGKKKPVQAVKEENLSERDSNDPVTVAMSQPPAIRYGLGSAQEGMQLLASLRGSDSGLGRKLQLSDRSIGHVPEDHGKADSDFRLTHANWVEETIRRPSFVGIQDRHGYPEQVWYAQFKESESSKPKHVFVFARLDGEDLKVDSFGMFSRGTAAAAKLNGLREGHL